MAQEDERRARDGVKRVLLDLLRNDAEVKLAVGDAIAQAKGRDDKPAITEAEIVTLIEQHLPIVVDAAPNGLDVEAVRKIFRSMVRQYLRPDAVQGSHATALYKESD